MSEKTELLLQELLDLHKAEAKRAQLQRWLRFTFGTLPPLIVAAALVWSIVTITEEISTFIEEAPQILEENINEFTPSLPQVFGSDPRE